jgi:hypothetical protein
MTSDDSGPTDLRGYDFRNLNLEVVRGRWADLESAINLFHPQSDTDEDTLRQKILSICDDACWQYLAWRSVDVRDQLENFEKELRRTKKAYGRLHIGIRQYFTEIHLINKAHFEDRIQSVIDECVRSRETLQEQLQVSPERRKPQFEKNYLAVRLLILFEEWRPGEATDAEEGEFRILVERVYHFLTGKGGDFSRALDHAFEQKDKDWPYGGLFPELLYWPEEFR